jgi:hypothetical protein
MKTTWISSTLIGTALLMSACPVSAPAQVPGRELQPRAVLASDRAAGFEERDLSGPRVGLMFAPGDAAIAHRLKEHGLGNIVSQFGWQFERQITPLGGGPTLVTEAIPLIGGVEYGKFVPSVTLAPGMRFKSGLEIGVGPSVTIVSTSGTTNTGLVVAVGKTLDYGDLGIPFNLAVSTNPKGTMVTLITGYAMHRDWR